MMGHIFTALKHSYLTMCEFKAQIAERMLR